MIKIVIFFNFTVLLVFLEIFLIKLFFFLGEDFIIFYYSRILKRKDILKLIKKENLIVYRIEKDGQGPFHHKDIDKNIIETITSNYTIKNNPGLFQDPKLKKIAYYLKGKNKLKQYVFGCKSKEDLKKWFSKENLELLEKEGFKIKKIKISHYFEGTNQVLFKITNNKQN